MKRKMCSVIAAVLLVSSMSLAVLVDDFESYSLGAVTSGNAIPPWSTSEAGSYADIVVDPLNAENQALSQYASGDYRDIRISTPLAIDTTGSVSFDILINAEVGVNTAIGMSYNEGMNWYGDYASYVRVIPNASTIDGQVQLSVRDGGSFVDNIAQLNIGQWYNIKLVIDTAGGDLATPKGGFDVYLDGAFVRGNNDFRFGYNGNALDTFVIMAGNDPAPNNAVQGNVLVDNINMVPEPATMLLLGLGGLFFARKK